MKAVKIIIVAVVLAALGVGIWKMCNTEPPKPFRAWKDQIPPECTGFAEIVEKSCDNEYGKLHDGDFDGLQTCYNSQKNLFDNDESSANCKEVIGLVLNNIHRERFVEMSNKEQSNKEWPNLEKMASLCDTHINIAGDSDSDLLRIKQGCTEYAALEEYLSNVNQQCNKTKPSSGLDSKWDMGNTRNLILSRPEANDPANHTKPYEDSEKSKVQARLFDAHVKYLKKFVEKAKANVTENPSKQKWGNWSGAVRRELDVFVQNAKVYGKLQSDVNAKVQEVKNALFDAHVAYLKAFVNNSKNVIQSPNKQEWEQWLDNVRGELTTFDQNASNTYGKLSSDVNVEVKVVKNTLFDTHVAYLNARIEQDSMAVADKPNLYDTLSDKLLAEIEAFDKNAEEYYGKSASNFKKEMTARVNALRPKTELEH